MRAHAIAGTRSAFATGSTQRGDDGCPESLYPGVAMRMRRFIPGILLALAAACPGQAEDLFFDSAGVRIHYTIEGKGEPVVLIHGWGVDLEWNWAEPGIIRSLAERYRVIAIDCRGHGRSDKPHDPKQYGMNMVTDVIRLLDHLKVQKAHIVGYSMGGLIAEVLLAGYPERVRTATIGGFGWEDDEGYRKRRLLTAESLEQGKGIGPLVEALTPPGEKAAVAQQMAAINQWFLERNDPAALAAVARGNADLRASETKLRANKLPALAVVGELDPLRPSVDRLASMMPNLEVVVVPGANHMFAVRSPEFLEAVKAFLATHAEK
jgi:pimeloyl-ACP methyl ester carboxylesterase